MARRTKEQAQQTRQDILMGALDVFSQKGFSRTSLNDIAKRIGMTRGAIYWHFKDKQELLIELMETMHEREEYLLAQKVAEVKSLDDMRQQFMARVEILESDAMHRKFVAFMSLQVEWATEKQMSAMVRGGTMRKAPFRLVREHLAMLQAKGEIRSEVDVAMVADITIGMFTGMVRTTLGGLTQTPLAKSMDAALQAVIASIRA